MPNDARTMWTELRRASLLFVLATAGAGAHAQLEKLFIEGRMIDGQSGVVIMDAELSVIDSLDRDQEGTPGKGAEFFFTLSADPARR